MANEHLYSDPNALKADFEKLRHAECGHCHNTQGIIRLSAQNIAKTGTHYRCEWCGFYLNEDFSENKVYAPEVPTPLNVLARLMGNGYKPTLTGLYMDHRVFGHCLSFLIENDLIYVGLEDMVEDESVPNEEYDIITG